MKFYVNQDEMDTTIEMCQPEDEEGCLTFREAKKGAIKHLKMIIDDCQNQISMLRRMRMKDWK